MAIQYLLELIKNSSPSHKPPTFNMQLILIIGMVSVIMSECFLAIFVFSILYEECNYTFYNSAILTAGFFFIQFLLAGWAFNNCLRKIYDSNFIVRELNTLKSTASAFIDGFKSK
jgi:hypothetical protein